jgi:hypothetical protein
MEDTSFYYFFKVCFCRTSLNGPAKGFSKPFRVGVIEGVGSRLFKIV